MINDDSTLLEIEKEYDKIRNLSINEINKININLDDIILESEELKPKHLKKSGKISGQKIYSNDSIKEYFINRFKSDPKLKEIGKTFEDGINSGRILVGYTSKYFFMHILRRLKRWAVHLKVLTDRGVCLGYFVKSEYRLLILLDHSVDLYGDPLFNIMNTVVHELLHMASGRENSDSYYKHTKHSYLIPFYSSFINNVVGNKPSIKLKYMDEHLKLLHFLSTTTNRITVGEFLDTWRNYFKREFDYDYDTANKYTNYIFLPYAYFIIGVNLTGNALTNMKRSVYLLYNAYEDIGVKNARRLTIPAQEICCTHEVVCVANSEKLSPLVAKLIKNINMKK